MKLKFRLLSDGSIIFFGFLKIQSRRKISKYFFRSHAILWAIFGSQIRRLIHNFTYGSSLKNYFFLCKFGINHFWKKNIISARFFDSVFEFLIKKKVHNSIYNYKILILIFLIFWFWELSVLKFCNNCDCFLELRI